MNTDSRSRHEPLGFFDVEAARRRARERRLMVQQERASLVYRTAPRDETNARGGLTIFRYGRPLPGFASSLLVGSLLAAFVIGGAAILGAW